MSLCGCKQQDSTIKLKLTTSAGGTPIVTDPATIEFGKINSGGSRELSTLLRNSTSDNVTISRLNSSCPCLTVELPSNEIAANNEVIAKVKINFKDEAQFAGALLITVQGIGNSNNVLFEFQAAVVVESGIHQ